MFWLRRNVAAFSFRIVLAHVSLTLVCWARTLWLIKQDERRVWWKFILTWLEGAFSFFFVEWWPPFPPLVSVLCLLFLISRRTQHIVIYSIGHQGNETQGEKTNKIKTFSFLCLLVVKLWALFDFLYCVPYAATAPCFITEYSILGCSFGTELGGNPRPLHACRCHAENPNERWRIDELNLFISYLPSLWLLVMWTKSFRLLAACQTAVLQPGLSAVEGDKS